MSAVAQDRENVTFERDYVDSPWWSKFWMSWAIPIIKYVNKHESLDDASQVAKMPDVDSSERTTKRMEDILERMESKNENFDYRGNMLWLVLQTFKGTILKVVIWGLAAELCGTFNLFFSSFFVNWLQNEGEDYEGYLYALGFVLLFYITQLFRVNYFFNSNYLGINIRKAVSCIMYKKALKLSQKSKAVSSTGKIVTIVSGELQTIDWGIQIYYHSPC